MTSIIWNFYNRMFNHLLELESAYKILDDFLQVRNPMALKILESEEVDFASVPANCFRDIAYYNAIKSMVINLKKCSQSAEEKTAQVVVIEPVLTAHPTEPLSDTVIEILWKISNSENPLQLFQRSLNTLFSHSLTPKHKLTVKEEVVRNLKWYERIIATTKDLGAVKVKPRSWAGGDADGNFLVDSLSMKSAAKMHSSEKFHEKMEIDVRQNSYIHSLAIADILQKVTQYLTDISSRSNYENELLNLLQNFKYIDLVISADDPALDVLAKENKRSTFLDIILSQGRLFTIIHKLERLFSSTTIEELERIKVIKRYPEIFTSYIISGCERFSDILQLLFLLKIYDLKVQLVPLFESKNAIELSDAILQKAFRNSHYQNAILNLTQKVMIGFSDSQKESGSMVLPIIEISIEKLKRLCKNSGISLRVFYGNGLDIARGGPSIVRPEQTIQGNHIRYNFIDKNTTYKYLADQVALSGSQDSFEMGKLNIALLKGVEAATSKFEKLWSREYYYYAVDEYLRKASPFYLFVRPNNFSSRPSKRNLSDSIDHPYSVFYKGFNESAELMQGIRAISWVNAIEGTFTYFNLWFGLLDALKVMEKECDLKELFETNSTFKDICSKALTSLEMSDFELAWEYFPVHLRPQKIQDVKAMRDMFYATLNTRNSQAEFFLAVLQIEATELKALFESHGIIIDQNIKKEIELKKKTLSINHKLMAYLNRAVVYEKNKVSSVLDISEEEFAEIAGAVFVAFTEYRTPVKI